MTEVEKIAYYIDSLRDKTKYEVNSKPHNTLVKAITTATHFEHLTRPSQRPEINNIVESQKDSIKCYHCQKPGHKSFECRKRNFKDNLKTLKHSNYNKIGSSSNTNKPYKQYKYNK